MNGIQMALKKFGRRYSGAGREGFSLSRPGTTEKSYGGTEIIVDPTIGPGRAANRAPNAQEMFRQREDAVAGNPLGGVGQMLSQMFQAPPEEAEEESLGASIGKSIGNAAGGALSRSFKKEDPQYTEEGLPVRVEAEKIPLGTEVFTRGIDQMPGKHMMKEIEREAPIEPRSSRIRAEIERRENKDFSKDGADYDKDHDWKDALRSAGLSALKALASGDPNASIGQQLGRGLGGAIGGGVAGAVDRNADEKLGNEIALANKYPEWARQFKRESEETNQRLGEEYKTAQIDTIREDDKRQRDNLNRQVEKDSAQVKRWEAMTDRDRLKLAGDEELRAMRDKWALAKDKNEKRRLDAVEKEMENRMIRSEADRNSREKVAGMREAGATGRAQLQTAARQALAEYEAAVKNGQQDKAIAARERLVQLKAQADQTPQ